MRWRGERESDNVEDQRGGGGMPGGPMIVGGGLSTLVIIVVALLFGIDPQALFGPPGGMPGGPGPAPGMPGPAMPGRPMPGGPGPGPAQRANPQDEELKHFVSVVLAETEDVWREQFREMGRRYRDPHLVLFDHQVRSACGFASAAVGPFYCPGDERVYLDLSFLHELRSKFHAPGEFAEAYVIAHEIGHHVQKQLGISQKVDAMRDRVSEREFNQLSVKLELQADFLAGVWAHHAQRTRNILEPGDIEAAVRAATAVGDDRLQMQQRGYVVPDSFTHGTSAQRVRWFKRGFASGNLADGDTFSATEL